VPFLNDFYVVSEVIHQDWEWDGETDIPRRPKRREAASLTMLVGDRSSINYIMPMAVGPNGYESTLEVHLDALSATTSLNDIRVVNTESCRVSEQYVSLRFISPTVHRRFVARCLPH